MSEVPPPKSDANYLESAPVAKQPASAESENVNTRKRRLTKAEQMTLEVLASFNGESFGNVLVKNKSFKEKLIETAAAAGGEDGEPTRKKTRLESAREEIANAFKDIPLGIDVISKRTTTPHNSNDVPVEVGSKRLTRLQKAKIEAIESFGGNDLDEVLGNKKKKQKKEEEKEDEKEDENETNETVSSNT
jgi:ribosomal protein S19